MPLYDKSLPQKLERYKTLLLDPLGDDEGAEFEKLSAELIEIMETELCVEGIL